MEVGSRLRRSCSLSQGQSMLPPMLVVTATPQSLVSNLEWKRYRLHEILPFTNLCWPLVGVLDFPCWAARVENICRLSSIHFSFLPGLSRPHLSVLPWLQVWFCPQRGVFCLSASSLPSPHLRPTLPHPFLRVCPQPPQQLSLNHSGFLFPHCLYTPIRTGHSFLAAVCFRQYVPQGQDLCAPQTCPVSSHLNL